MYGVQERETEWRKRGGRDREKEKMEGKDYRETKRLIFGEVI
jgi:hypothetical protein